jgi:hypothetical protein
VSGLSLIKSVPGNVSLESMLTEIGKHAAVRGGAARPGCLLHCAEGDRRAAGRAGAGHAPRCAGSGLVASWAV